MDKYFGIGAHLEHAILFLIVLLIALIVLAIVALTTKGPGFFQTMITEDDANMIVCPMRIAGLLVITVFLFLVAWDVIVNGVVFAYMPFAVSAGALLRHSARRLFSRKGPTPDAFARDSETDWLRHRRAGADRLARLCRPYVEELA